MTFRHTFRIEPPETNYINVSNLPFKFVVLKDDDVIIPDWDLNKYYNEYKNDPKRPNVFMDIHVYSNGTGAIKDYGCVMDGKVVRPVWITEEILESEKRKACKELAEEKEKHNIKKQKRATT